MKYILTLFCVLISWTFLAQAQGNANDNEFVVVLDAGHGGKDPGNQGNGFREKEIALKVALEVGKLLGQDKNIKVIYTRTTDVFVTLKGRAEKANKAKADLFVSIHLNAFETATPHGTETYVLGTYRNKDNLDIAMKENSVIYLEEDYEDTYDGFDPTSPASYIGMTLMQEEYLDQSIFLADNIQTEYTTKLKRYDRGVKKAGFLVLRETYMPSVLTEIGFLTHRAEGQYLNSARGQKQIAKSIADGILAYKRELKWDGASKPTVPTKQKETKIYKDITFRVQIGVGTKPLEPAPYNFKGLEGVDRKKEGDVYKYYFGQTSDYLESQDILRKAKTKGFTEAFIVAFKNGEKVSVDKALKTNAN